MLRPPSLWPVWGGLLLSVVAFLSYPVIFARYPLTRDFPWANLLLFAGAVLLAAVGVRRAFSLGAPRGRRIAGVAGALFTGALLLLFVFGFFVFARELPASHGAPQVGQKAPEFRLPDANGKAVALSELLATPIHGQPARGALLVFYRGYW